MEMDNVNRKNIKFNVGAITIVLLLVVGMGLLVVNQLQYHKKESQRTHFILDNQSVQDSVNDPSIAVSENRSLHEVNMDNIIYAISSDEQEISYWGEQGLNSPYAPKTASDLNNAIAKVLNEKYRAEDPDGLIHIENYYLLANETASGTPLKGNFGHMTRATVYLLVYHMKYSFNGDRIEEYEGNFVPTAITFNVSKSGEYTLEEYWTPRTGTNYEKDVRNKFPGDSADNALNSEKFAEDLIKKNWRLANEYFSQTKSS